MPKQIDKCPECKSTRIIHDYKRGDTVCGSCGLVLSELEIDHGPETRFLKPEDRNKERTGAPMSVMLHDRGLSTEIGFIRRARRKNISKNFARRLGSLRRWQRRATFRTSAERNLMMGLRDISRMASVLGLPVSVKETAALMHRNAVKRKLIIGRSTFGIASASVYAACRKCGVPRTIEEVTKVSQLNKATGHARRELARYYRVLSRELNLGLETPTPYDFIERMSSDLKLSNDVRKRSVELINKAVEKNISVGKSPISITGAAIYISSRLSGERCRQKDVAESADVTEVTIRNRYKELVKKLNISLPKD